MVTGILLSIIHYPSLSSFFLQRDLQPPVFDGLEINVGSMATIVDHGQFPCTCFNVTTVSGSIEASHRASVSRSTVSGSTGASRRASVSRSTVSGSTGASGRASVSRSTVSGSTGASHRASVSRSTVSGSTEASRRASVGRLFRCPQIMGRARDHTSCVKLLFQGFVHVVPDDWIAARPMDS